MHVDIRPADYLTTKHRLENSNTKFYRKKKKIQTQLRKSGVKKRRESNTIAPEANLARYQGLPAFLTP